MVLSNLHHMTRLKTSVHLVEHQNSGYDIVYVLRIKLQEVLAILVNHLGFRMSELE